jgi:HEAT repeat protein
MRRKGLVVLVLLLVVGFSEGQVRPPVSPVVQELVDVVRDWKGAPLWSRVRAAETLGKMGPEARAAVPALAEFLVDPVRADPPVIDEMVVQTLGRIGRPAKPALPALMRVAGKSFDLERAVAAATDRILSGGADEGDVPTLIKNLHDKDEGIRLRAAKTLGSMGPVAKEAVDGLTESLHDADADVRHQALEALRRIRPNTRPTEAEAGVFIQDLHDPDPAVRLRAVKSLRTMSAAGPTVGQALLEASQDSDPDVRRMANEALNQLPPPR